MLIEHYEQCQERLPGMPAIGCDPCCALTSMTLVCANPTYDTCPRYKAVEQDCPACQEAMVGPVQMYRDTVDWTLVCPECGLEIPASSTEAQINSFWPAGATG